MNRTNIAYLNFTFNPVTGCTHGCPECWARVMSRERLAVIPGLSAEYKTAYKTFAPTLHPDRLGQPAKARQPSVIGVCFMGDLFDPALRVEARAQVFKSCADAPQHSYIFLTKSYALMAERVPMYLYADNDVLGITPHCARDNYFFGASCRCQTEMDRAAPALMSLADKGARVWISFEPLQGPVQIPQQLLPRLSGVILGGTSGKYSGPLHPAWVESVRVACELAGVPFFFKQWGEWAPKRRVFEDNAEFLPITNTLVAMDDQGNVVDRNQDFRAEFVPLGSWYFERVGLNRAGYGLNGNTYRALAWKLAK